MGSVRCLIIPIVIAACYAGPSGLGLYKDSLRRTAPIAKQGRQFSAESSSDAKASIVKYEQERSNNGNYRYSFETSNGLEKEETGEVQNENSDQQSLEVRGSYRYFTPDGYEHIVYYVADKYGYRPRVQLIAPQNNKETNNKKPYTIEEDKVTPTNKDEFTDFIGTAVLATLSG